MNAETETFDLSSTNRRTVVSPSLITMDVDPLGAYPHVTNGTIIDSMGLLPQILSGYFGLEPTFKIMAEKGYTETAGFKPFWSTDMSAPTATVEDNGVYQYPGDPARSPLAKLSSEDEDCYIYESGFIAVKDEEGKWLTARLD
jgi:hypothetical protein